MSNFLPARWLACLPALAAAAAGAQTAPVPDATAAGATPSLAYRSAMEGYKPFADEKPIPWKQANDTVRERGGWRAYAKEGTADAEEKAQGATDPHAGHSMPMASPPKARP